MVRSCLPLRFLRTEIAWRTSPSASKKRNRMTVSDYGRPAKPAFVDVTGDRVYAVYPVTAALSVNGRKTIERGVWTVVLRKDARGWRIGAVTWSTLGFAPAR